jgi:hypothetical protein
MGTGGANPTVDADAARLAGTRRRTARRSGQTLVCGWCGLSVVVPARGRVPKWCSSSCRHRAWEMARAAQSGRAAVQVVDRVVVDRVVEVDGLFP